MASGPPRERSLRGFGTSADHVADEAAIRAACTYAGFPYRALTPDALRQLRRHRAYGAFRRIAEHHLALAPSATPQQLSEEMAAEVEAARAERRFHES